MASLTANLTMCRPIAAAARILTAALGLFGVWALVICLVSRQISPVLLPISAVAFVSATARVRFSLRGRGSLAGVETSHIITLASSAALGPFGGVFPAVFSCLGRLVMTGNSSRLMISMPAAGAAAGIVFHFTGGASHLMASGWPLVPFVLASIAYFTVHCTANLCMAVIYGDNCEGVSVSLRRFLLPVGMSYPVSVLLASAPAQTALAVVMAALAVLASAFGLPAGRESRADDVIEEDEESEEYSEDECSVEKPSLLDGLTGVANLRYLLMFLNQEINRSSRRSHPLSILLLDVDGLSKINKSAGWDAGDEVLKQIARNLQGMLRDYDVVARYTDDEFAVVLPETAADNAYEIAERIHKFITTRSFSDSLGNDLEVSISIGVASFPDHGESADELISSAHHALNRAKFAGSNHVQSCHKLARAG